MGNLKKLDIEGMLGRVNHIKLGDEYWNDFFAADSDLVEIDRLISECGIDGISSVGYISQADKIGMLQHDCDLLKEYPKNLVEELIPVDTEFAHNVNNALNALSAIRVDDIRIKNTLGVTVTQYFNEHAISSGTESTWRKKDLTLADFVGYFDDYLMGRETSFVKGFTDVLYSKETLDGKNLQTVLREKNSDLRVLLYGSEFDMKKYQPNAVQWSNLENAATCGLYSIEIAILGYDTITKERLTEEERAIRGLTGVVGLIPLLMGWGQAGSSLEGSVQYLSMAGGNVAQTSTEYACEELGVPPLISAIISTAAGMGVGVATYNVGNGYVKQQNTAKGIFDGIDKDAAFPKNRYVNTSNGIPISGKNTEGKFENVLDDVLRNKDLTREEYLQITRTSQHELNQVNKAIGCEVRMELTDDVMDSTGALKPGTRIGKVMSEGDIIKKFPEGDKAQIGGCALLERDLEGSSSGKEIINKIGGEYPGNPFVNESGEVNPVYVVTGEYMEGQPAIYARISATAEPKMLSENVVEQFYNKYPDKTYNGLKLTDLSNDNSFLNQRWEREARSYVNELSSYTGIEPENIFVGKPSQYNNPLNPDRGLGITLNQGSTVEFGVPEFYVKDGLAKIKNGTIYKIYEGKVTPIASINKYGTIHYNK